MSVPVLFLGADLERVSPLTILDDPFNSKRMQRGMLHFLNREWTQINANFSRGSGRCAPKRLYLSPFLPNESADKLILRV